MEVSSITRARGRVMTDQGTNKDIAFYNPHDGTKGRDGGPYLDAVVRQQSEVNRALVEGREPADLQGVLPADAGTPLVVAQHVVDNSLFSNPSMANRPGAGLTTGNAEDDADISVADPLSVLPVNSASDQPTEEGTPEAVTDSPDENTIKENDEGNSTVPANNSTDQGFNFSSDNPSNQ